MAMMKISASVPNMNDGPIHSHCLFLSIPLSVHFTNIVCSFTLLSVPFTPIVWSFYSNCLFLSGSYADYLYLLLQLSVPLTLIVCIFHAQKCFIRNTDEAIQDVNGSTKV